MITNCLIIFLFYILLLFLIYFILLKQKKAKKKEYLSNKHKFLDHNFLLKKIPENIKKKMSITLKKNKKGIGLYSTKLIKKGSVITLYPLIIHKDTSKNKYKSLTKCIYCFTLYSNNGEEINNLIGDVDNSIFKPTKIGNKILPYWGHFANEPDKNSKANSKININTRENYKNRKVLKVGDKLTYKLIATKNIKPNTEITWCYGNSYNRDYETSCSENE